MKQTKSRIFSNLIIGSLLLSTDACALEKLGLITVESSTIDINKDDNNISSSSIINKQRLEEVNVKNINDVLKSIPGTTISTRTGEMAQIHFRGVGQQQFMSENSGVAIIIDGVPVRQQAGGVRINLKDIESIKVIKGSASYLYGDTALAGALIITTKRLKGSDSIDLEAIMGSHNFKDTLFSISKNTDDFLMNFNANYRTTDGYWTDSELWTKSINGKFTYFINQSSDISLSADITDKYDQAGSRSVTSGVNEAYNNPKGNGNSFTKDNNIDLDKYILTYNKDFNNNSNFLFSTYLYKDFYTYLSNPLDLDNDLRTQEKYTQEQKQNLKQYGIKTEYKTEGKNLASLFGIELGKREYETTKDIVENYSEYDRRKKRNIDYFKGENTISKDNEAIYALYTELKYNINHRLSSTFNMRYDYQKKEYLVEEKQYRNDIWDTSYSSKQKSFNNLSYRFGLTYKLSSEYILFSNISTAFETPDVEDLHSNENIKEQKSINYELGLRANLHNYNFESSIYQLDNKNIISPEGGTYSFGDKMDNSGDTRSRGFELALSSNSNKKFYFDLAYTFLNNEYTKFNTFKHTYQNRKTEKFDIIGNTVPRSSKHTINLRLNYKVTNKLKLISEIYAKSSYYADETNIIKMPGYTLLNLQARYKTKILKNNIEFFFKINNALDKQYFRSAYLHRDKRGKLGIDQEDASIVVDPGREFYFGFKYSF